jgi:stage V sporulation protein B
MSNFLAKSTMIVTISEIIFNLSSYVVQVTMGRVLGPADYGVFGIIVTLTTMTVVLIGQSVPTAMSKYLSEIFETDKGMVAVIKKQTIRIQVVLIGLVTIAFYFLAPVIARVLHDPSLTNPFRLSTLVIPAFAAASFYFYYYTGLHKFKIQAWLKTSRGVLRMVFIIGLALLLRPRGLAIQGAILGYVAAPSVLFLIGLAIDKFKVKKEFPAVPRRDAINRVSTEDHAKTQFDWRKLAIFAWPVTIFLIAYQFLNTIDLYLVKGILRSDVQTGLYNAAYTVGTIPYNLFYALTIVLLPAVSKTTSAGQDAETEKIVSQSLRFLVLLLIPVCVLMSYFSFPLMVIFFSKRFALSAPVMSIYVFAEGFLTIFYVLTFVLNGAGKVKIPMYAALIGLFLNTVVTYFLIKAYGLIGAASGTAFMGLAVMLFTLAYTYREFGYIFSAKSFWKMTVAALVMTAAAFIFSRNSYLFLLWSAILFSLYLFVLYLLRELKKEDLDVFLKMLKREKPAVSELD